MHGIEYEVDFDTHTKGDGGSGTATKKTLHSMEFRRKQRLIHITYSYSYMHAYQFQLNPLQPRFGYDSLPYLSLHYATYIHRITWTRNIRIRNDVIRCIRGEQNAEKRTENRFSNRKIYSIYEIILVLVDRQTADSKMHAYQPSYSKNSRKSWKTHTHTHAYILSRCIVCTDCVKEHCRNAFICKRAK